MDEHHSLPRENLSLTRPRPSRATPSALRTSCEENVTLPSNSPLGDAGSLPKETNRARAKSSIEDDRPTQLPKTPLPTNPAGILQAQLNQRYYDACLKKHLSQHVEFPGTGDSDPFARITDMGS